MDSQNEKVIMFILDFLRKQNYHETAHMLEQETSLFFDVHHFEKIIREGNFDEAESYLSAFTKLDDNIHSIQTYFAIRKLKFLEALYRNDRVKALNIVMTDLRAFSCYNPQVIKDAFVLLTTENFRLLDAFVNYRPMLIERYWGTISMNLVRNPSLGGKLQFSAAGQKLGRMLEDATNNGEASTSGTKRPRE